MPPLGPGSAIVYVQSIELIVSGTVDSFTIPVRDEIRSRVALALGVDFKAVTVTVKAASVALEIAVASDTSAESADVGLSFSHLLATPVLATKFFNGAFDVFQVSPAKESTRVVEYNGPPPPLAPPTTNDTALITVVLVASIAVLVVLLIVLSCDAWFRRTHSPTKIVPNVPSEPAWAPFVAPAAAFDDVPPETQHEPEPTPFEPEPTPFPLPPHLSPRAPAPAFPRTCDFQPLRQASATRLPPLVLSNGQRALAPAPSLFPRAPPLFPRPPLPVSEGSH